MATLLKRRSITERLETRLCLSVDQLITNGGFEGAVSEWNATGAFQADSRFAAPRTGTGYAYLATAAGASGNSLNGSISQTIALPNTATSASITFYTRISTSETTTTAANDMMTVRLTDLTGNTLQTLGTYSNLNASTGYVERTIAISRALIGQTVKLEFAASTDAALPTTFRVDDVSMIAVSPATGQRVVGYLPQYRYASSFSKLDLSALTHINYFSVTANADGSLNTSGVSVANMTNAVSVLHAAGITVSITIGPQSFSTIAASAALRNTFANNIVNFALTHNLDGIDMDWEPPATSSTNIANYGHLIDALYTYGNPQRMLLTAAVNPIQREIPLAATAKMDWINIMGYDFAPANHSPYNSSINSLVGWRNYGVPANKLVLGVPFYGRKGTSWSDTVSSTYGGVLNASRNSTGAFPAPDVDLYDGTYFNGIETIRRKTQYVVDNNFGGVMIWEVGQDYFPTTGGYGHHSLLPVIKSVALGTDGIGAVTASPTDNSTVSLGQTQMVSVTITATVEAAGVLAASLVGAAVNSPQDWVSVEAGGTITHTFSIPISETTAGTRTYELYIQFRAGASAGPLTNVLANDAIKLVPYRLNWQNIPATPTLPISPTNGATLTSSPTLFDWADIANATSYEIFLNGVSRATVSSSQWSPIGSLINGTHTWSIIAKNGSGSAAGPTWSFTILPPDTTPPTVVSSNFDFERGVYTLTFSEAINEATLGADELSIIPATGGTPIASTSVSYDATTRTATFSFGATGLADGNYTAQLPSTAITDLAGNPNASTYVSASFFVLAGDANRDRTVNFDDLLILAQNYGTSGKAFSQGNFNYSADGLVDFDDLLILAQRYGTTLLSLPPVQEAAKPTASAKKRSPTLEIN